MGLRAQTIKGRSSYGIDTVGIESLVESLAVV